MTGENPFRRRRSVVYAGGALALGLAVALFWRASGPGENGEALPQRAAAPGMSSRGVELWGMPNRELYTPLDSPHYVSAAEAEEFLTDHDRVYYLRKGSDTCYVFPEVLLTSYHVVNDVIEGEPVGVTFCFLAGSACHFSRRVEDSVLTFGLTGQLYGGNSVLFDKETGTDWLQMNGEPLRGHFFGKARLGAKPLAHTTWRRIKERKDIKVLAPVRSMAEYRRFQQDMEAERLGQKVVESQKKLDPRLLPYTKGLGIVVHDQARFYPENPLGPRSLHEDRVGSWALLVIRDGKEDLSRIYRRRHKNRILSFELTDGAIIDRQTHSTWNEDGRCVAGPLAGAELEAPSYSEVYWFVWSSLYSDTAL